MADKGDPNSEGENPEAEANEAGNAKPKKKKGRLDRWVMGILVGSAIGSVIGMALAPKSGKETRKIIKDKSKEIYKKGQDLSEKIKKPVQEYQQKHSGFKEIPHEPVESVTPTDSKTEKESSENP